MYFLQLSWRVVSKNLRQYQFSAFLLLQTPKFPEFNVAISTAIARLGGAVFPKLNWSSPKVGITVCTHVTETAWCSWCIVHEYWVNWWCWQDAAWITLNGSLKCTCPREIYLLMKSSSFLGHDLVEPCVEANDKLLKFFLKLLHV